MSTVITTRNTDVYINNQRNVLCIPYPVRDKQRAKKRHGVLNTYH